MSRSDAPPEVSVVIPFRNGARHLAALFDSLCEQDCRGSWEVIAVDNGSTDASRRIVEGFSTRLALSIATATAKANPSYARNEGVGHARGEKLLFIDADDAIAPHYVTAMSAALDAHDLVTSRVDSNTLNPQWVRDAHGPPWQESSVATFFEFLPATGVNIGIRRDLFDQLGRFSEEFSGSEDVAFVWKAQLERNITIQLVPEAVYRYRYRDSCGGLYRQAAHWGRDTVVLYRRFRQHGMPGRSLERAISDWAGALWALATSRRPDTRAEASVRIGYCVGRLHGTLRYRVRYL